MVLYSKSKIKTFNLINQNLIFHLINIILTNEEHFLFISLKNYICSFLILDEYLKNH